jgi:hypothetical protein
VIEETDATDRKQIQLTLRAVPLGLHWLGVRIDCFLVNDSKLMF